MALSIQVKDKVNQECLFQCPLSDEEKAFEFARMMESIGVEVEIVSPSITESLAAELGVVGEGAQNYFDSVEQELEDHDCSGPCEKEV